MKLIVGLGNPGPKYDRTRHNVGFRVVDELARRWGQSLTQEKFHAWFAKGRLGDQEVALLKPTTFMNRSGQSVLAAGRFFQIELFDLLVISDDLALPVGRLRIRAKGSSGGQKGLQDIIERLGTSDFARLRLGIGAAVGDPTDYVLTRFDPQEEELIDQTCRAAADAVECWVSQGTEAAMNRYNAAPKE